MNSRDHLDRCLVSLSGACRSSDFHVVVVDNCSTDGTAEMVRRAHPTVELIVNTSPHGFGANHNIVLRRARAADAPEFVLVLNDDTILEPGSVDVLVAAARSDPTTGAVVPRVLGSDGAEQLVALRSTGFLAVLAAHTISRPGPRVAPERADWLNGCCLLLPCAAVREVGMFDERFFMYSEDVDLSLRLRRRGYRLWQARDATIVHLGQATTSRPELSLPMTRQALRSQHLLRVKYDGEGAARAAAAALRTAIALRAAVDLALSLVPSQRWRRSQAGRRWATARPSWGVPVFPQHEHLPSPSPARTRARRTWP